MAFTVKQKIQWGTLFLFLLLILLGTVGIFHLVRLRDDAQTILKNNYESLDYCMGLQQALDNNNLLQFDSILRSQEGNITENGERKATANVRALFNQYRASQPSDSLLRKINASIHDVLALNMSAIEQKNNRANITADRALTYITVIAAIIFIIGFSFSFNFPSILTDPLAAMISGIKEVAAKNYNHRIYLDRKDEFGQMATAFNDMAERLQYFESSNLNKLIFEKTRAEAVINSLKDASIGIDQNNVVLFANQRALQLLGLAPAQIVSHTVDEISRSNDLFNFLIEDKAGMPFKIIVENRENYFVKEVVELGDAGANGKVIVVKNITSFKELDTAKTNFIATISHELKTPLASSDFSIKLLEDERTGLLNAEQKEFVEALKFDNKRMLKILSELLNLAQIEAGKIQLNIVEASAYDICHTALQSVNSYAKEKIILIKTDLEPSLPFVKADADKTAWVMNNFLTNAIKYSNPGSEVLVTVQRKADSVAFLVGDSGPGIAEEHVDRIFDRFYRVSSSSSTGNGLGLSISREFIEAQGGRIWVESRLQKGSVFGFALPIVQ